MGDFAKLFSQGRHGDTPGHFSFNHFSSFIRPIQAIPDHLKNEEWANINIDWLEWQGLMHIRERSLRYLKNYKMAAGYLDKSDYMPSPQNEFGEFLNMLSEEGNEVTEIKFYPLLPVIINTLCDEFEKFDVELTYKAVDENSINTFLQDKMEMIWKVVMRDIDQYVQTKLDPNASEEEKQQQKQQLLSGLPQIEEMFKKSYRQSVEIIVEKIHKYDNLRLSLKEKFVQCFKDLLCTDSFFMEFDMGENDYDIRNISPLFAFYRKSPSSNYISDGEYFGYCSLMTLSEIIDKFGKYFPMDVIEMWEKRYPNISAKAVLNGPGYANDGTFYQHGEDNAHYMSVSKEGGIDYQRLVFDLYPYSNIQTNILTLLVNNQGGADPYTGLTYFRVTKVYWKTLKKIGILTRKRPNGTVEKNIVSSNYKVIDKPVYDTSLYKDKSEKNLIQGEHIDWFYTEEVWGGIKIGPNLPTFYNHGPSDIKPVYIGIGAPKPGPLSIQIKDGDNIFGVRLPVEGYVNYETGTPSVPVVELCKPYQIGYNLVNNQIMDILLDEIGNVLAYDPSALDTESLGADIKENPYLAAYIAMKQYKVFPINNSDPTRNPQSNIPIKLQFDDIQRLSTRIELAKYFRMQCLETLGIAPERLGRPTSDYQSARNTEIYQSNSFSATSKYFNIILDKFMPRFHETRTYVFQTYVAQGRINKHKLFFNDDETVLIESLQNDFALRTFAIFPTNRVNFKNAIENVRSAILNNPNLGADMEDILHLADTNTYAGLKKVLQNITTKRMQMAQQQMEAEKQKAEMEMQKKLQEIKANYEGKIALLERELEVERERIKAGILQSEIRAAGYLGVRDYDMNQRSDFQDYMEALKKESQYEQMMQTEKIRKEIKDKELQTAKEIQDKKSETELKKKQIELEIAKTNKNKYDNEKE